METIKVEFKGFVEVDKDDIGLYGADGDTIESRTIRKLSTEQIVEGLKDGIYMLNFVQAYANALDGDENYEFSSGEVE